jgi:2-polyprenyl-6-methoxyphenol hydroxylase-like FAD-dependent oxidoreductase
VSQKYAVPLLIAGGGIGGLAAALALSQKGYPVHVVEKSAEFGEIGAGIQLAPNATGVLDRLGVLDEISKSAVFPQHLVLMDALAGKPITSLALGEKFRSAYKHPYLVMHRSDLLTILLQACQASDLITLETSKDVITVDDLGDGARVTFTDDSCYECDALIGADGLWSTIRQFVIDDTEPICAQFVAYRGAIPIEEISEHAGMDSVLFWTGPNMHFVQYPLRRGELYNQVAVFKSDRYKPDSDDWGTSDELEEHFSRTCPEVKSGLKLIKRNRRWPMCDRPPTDNWTRNHITLLGDAAHPMLQYIAQGACQAIEDAAYLADAFARHRGDIHQAFIAYQEVRIPRTARVQQTARFFGEICHIDGVGAILRNALLSQRASDDYGYTDWLYGYQYSANRAEEVSRVN